MSSQGPAIVHYEVYALDGQRWTLHARFRREEREDALEEAKSVESTLGMIAKVIRETYYPGDNTSEDVLVYKSDKNFKPRPQVTPVRRRAYARGQTGSDSGISAPDFRGRGKPKRQESSTTALIKLLLVVAASIAIACGAAAIVNNFVMKLPGYGATISGDQASLIIFVTFVAAFLASAVPLAFSVFDWRNARMKPMQPAHPAPIPAAAVEPPPPPPPPEPSPSPDVIEETPVPATEEEQAPVATEPPAPAEPEAAPEADQGGAAGQEPATEETPAPAATGDGQDQKPAPQTENPLENLRMTMIRLLSSLLGEIQKVRPNLDAYNLFGIDLVLAGAIDFLGTEKKLSQEEKSTILRETIEVMGTRADIARSFADKYEDYLGEPKYLSMVQVGRSSMEALLAGADLAGEEMMAAFTLWNRPQPTTQTAPGTITVLFTDMVGSTDFTQSRGDHAAQDILRRHNSIVRSALAEFVGREIKHTGDGIMASFASAANGVEAAISIQRACEAHNARNPDLPLHLRIGLNSGEPIQEGDDLFGTTVQLSARVCAKAAANEILCTNVVRELSAGKDLTFDSKGIQELKGFKDPVPLYAVRWALPVETSTSGPVPAGGGDADPDSASVKGPETTRTSTKASAPKARKEGKARPRAAARPSEPPEAPKA